MFLVHAYMYTFAIITVCCSFTFNLIMIIIEELNNKYTKELITNNCMTNSFCINILHDITISCIIIFLNAS